MNKIEVLKAEKDGLDILNDIPAFSKDGWESIPTDDRDRLKWAGIFFRRQTPGRFMMRIRISNGISNSAQFRAIAGISDDYGKGSPISPPASRFSYGSSASSRCRTSGSDWMPWA